MNAPIDRIEESADTRPPAARRYHRAIFISVVVHIVGLTALLFWYLPSGSDQAAPRRMAASQTGSQGPTRPSDLPKPIENPEVPADQILSSIESQIEKYDEMSDERKLSELEKNLERLDAIATEESVRQVTSTIANTLGIDEETYVPKEEPAEGSFDTATAQLLDVTRSQDADGHLQYESVLVDAEGRTLKLPMSSSEGETAYNTFEQMRKFPMAAGIYRSVVMPMMQKMIEAGDLVERATVEAERINQDPPSPENSPLVPEE